VVTNRSPYGSYRGWGQPKANFAHERMVDLLARRLGMDPREVRKKNFVPPTAFPYASPVFYYDSGRYADCLDLCVKAVEQAGWPRRRAEARENGIALGIGYGFHVEITAFGPSRILNMAGLQHSGFDEEVVRIDSTGRVTVYSGQSAMGQGVQTALAQVAAQSLGVPLEDVTVVVGDTDTCPYTGYGTGASRAAAVGGGAVMTASTRLKEKVLRIAGGMLEVAPQDLVICDGVISVAGDPDKAITMAQIGDAAYRRMNGALPESESPTLEEREVFDPANVAFSYGCTAVLAEVDTETGAIRLLGYLIAHDCGTVINPMIVDGQLHGGAAQAIGGAVDAPARGADRNAAVRRPRRRPSRPGVAAVPPGTRPGETRRPGPAPRAATAPHAADQARLADRDPGQRAGRDLSRAQLGRGRRRRGRARRLPAVPARPPGPAGGRLGRLARPVRSGLRGRRRQARPVAGDAIARRASFLDGGRAARADRGVARAGELDAAAASHRRMGRP
jgi:hypothetical protein